MNLNHLVLKFRPVIVRFLIFLPVIAIWSCIATPKEVTSKPNVIIFYVDDLGYGDVRCYGAKGVKTPNIDALATNGIRFTDGHCTASMCTPSRYSLLTGNYAFRNNAAILPGDAPLLIDTAIQTLPKVFKSAGYRTAVVGKWHLGLGYGRINWNQKISPGANEVGFDYSFLIPATGDRVPTVFVENGKVVNLDPNDPIEVSYSERIDTSAIGLEAPDQLKQLADDQHSQTIVNGVSRIGYMTGGESARWIDEDFPYVLNEKSKEFLSSNSDKPFFLYYSFHDIHVPRVPNKAFQGKSTMGPRGDAIAQMDWVIGDMIETLRQQDKLQNTLIIFTSDNGPVLNDGYEDQAVQLLGDHDPTGGFKGGKYSAYEAGTRVPTIVYWQNKVRSTVSSAIISQVDLLASMAKLVDVQVNETVIDSKDQLDTWLGISEEGRTELLEESFTLSLRSGDWKYIRPFAGSTPDWLKNKDIANGLSQEPQLFNLNDDPGETFNLADQFPDKTKTFEKMIQDIEAKTKSTL